MKAIIPVAGVGSRLRPHTYTLPKVLLNVAGKPILGHILEELQNQGVDECCIIVGYMGDLVEEYVRKNFNLNVTFINQEERKGLGHSIWLAREVLDEEPVLIILGDTIFEVDLARVINSRQSALGVKEVEDPRRFGVAEISGEGIITRLVEKPENPTTNLALVGLYYITNTALLSSSLNRLVNENIRTRGEYQLTDALQIMIDEGEQFTTFSVDGWYDCGKSETLLSTNRHLLSRRSTEREFPDAVVIPPVYISPNARVERAVIGPNATIADDATVVDSIVRDSIISDGATVQQSLLEGSIIGNNAAIRGRFIHANVGDSSAIDVGTW